LIVTGKTIQLYTETQSGALVVLKFHLYFFLNKYYINVAYFRCTVSE